MHDKVATLSSAVQPAEAVQKATDNRAREGNTRQWAQPPQRGGASPLRQGGVYFVRYAIAILIVVVAFLCRELVGQHFGRDLPHYVTFYPAVVFVALVGGLGPGLLATVVAALLAVFWILPPQGQFAIAYGADAVGLAVFSTTSLTVSVVAELYRRSREKLAGANAYNRSLLEASLDPLVTIGPDGKITDVNAATEAVTGCPRAALIGTDFSDYFTEPDNARAGYQQVFREGFVRDYPLELRHRDGHLTSVLYNASIYRDQGGQVIGVFAAARDITERKRAEEAVRRANTYNRSLLEASLDPLVTIGPDGKITDVNAATEAVTGCPRAALIGTDFSDYFTEPEKARAGYQQVFREGFVRDYPLELRRWDGHLTSVLYNASVYRDESGADIGVFAAARDVTARKRAEEEIRRFAEELRRSNQELEHFAYVASHDLQEPLRTVGSFSQLLARRYQGKLDPDADDFIAFIVEGARRMQTLINDLLAFSRIGTRGSPFTRVACEKVYQTAKENLDAAIAESGAVITHDPLPTVVADQTQLTQLFQNLFSNAIKFRRPQEPPRIHVSATRQDGAWRFSVRDNGIGIEPRYFDRIFVIFQRLHGREDYPGTGIGLAVCKKIVERHGGRMWVESEPGKSSTFQFTIPDEGRKHDERSPSH